MVPSGQGRAELRKETRCRGLAGSIAASLNLAIRSSWFIHETTCKESLPQWGGVLKI